MRRIDEMVSAMFSDFPRFHGCKRTCIRREPASTEMISALWMASEEGSA